MQGVVLDRKIRDREGQRWDRVRDWGRQGRGLDPVGEEITDTGCGQEMFVVDRSRNIFYSARHKVERMDYAVGG